MYIAIFSTFCLVSWATSTPVNILHREQASPMDEVVFIPYDVEYVPIEVAGPPKSVRTSEDEKLLTKPIKKNEESYIKPLKLNEQTLKVFEEQDAISSSKTELDENHKTASKNNDADGNSIEASHAASEDGSSSFDLFEDRFNSDASQSSEDFVLVPISVLRKLQGSNDGKTHVVAKRQAPGVVPLARFPRAVRNRQRFGRGPALVAYMNNYDHFPTVA